MKPAALEKASALHRFAAMTGQPPKDFAVIATLGEGYELLDYLASGGCGRMRDHELLLADIEEAKLAGDPWLVLNDWKIAGLKILRADKVLQ